MDKFGISIELNKLREEIEFRKAKEEYERLLRLQSAARSDIISLSWNETEYPRDERGRFASAGGGRLTEAQYMLTHQKDD